MGDLLPQAEIPVLESVQSDSTEAKESVTYYLISFIYLLIFIIIENDHLMNTRGAV